MANEQIKQDILEKIRHIAASNQGKPPGREKFLSETGIKPHTWRGKFWRSWGDALAEAGFAPNELQASYTDEDLLRPVLDVTKKLGRFPSSSDLEFELQGTTPGAKTILARWRMGDLAAKLASFATDQGEDTVAEFAHGYRPPRRSIADVPGDEEDMGAVPGFVYMQRHGSDYKIGFTKSLNKRGRQIPIELPQEIELVHSILTDDPAGVEGYWHRRFADKRTRGEWFKLTKADVAAFKKWSKIW
jgi:hypothetical protein